MNKFIVFFCACLYSINVFSQIMGYENPVEMPSFGTYRPNVMNPYSGSNRRSRIYDDNDLYYRQQAARQAQINAFMEDFNAISQGTGDFIMSFLDNPWHHSNTKKIYDAIIQIQDLAAECISNYKLLNISDNDILVSLNNITSYLDIMERITGAISHNYQCHISAYDFDKFIKPVIDKIGWKTSIIAYSQYATVYEYSYLNFKMTLIRNNLGYSNSVNYKLFRYMPIQNKEDWFTQGTISGGNFNLIQYTDDEFSKEYYKITKVTSERTNY